MQHGKEVFSVNCGFCHGSDARGGESGPNLVRSELVLDDQQGELIGDVVRNGRVDKGTPKFDLAAADISAIATFLHSQPTGDRGGRPSTPINILVGDAKAGEAYFNGSGKCSTCHSVTGDLAGIGAKYDPKDVAEFAGVRGRRRARVRAQACHTLAGSAHHSHGNRYPGASMKAN